MHSFKVLPLTDTHTLNNLLASQFAQLENGCKVESGVQFVDKLKRVNTWSFRTMLSTEML